MWQAHRKKIALFILVAVPLALLASSAGANVGTERHLASRFLSSTMTWGNVGTTGLLASIGGWFDGIFESDDEARLAELEAEVSRLREEKTRLIGVLQENERLRRLVGFKENHPEFELVPAQIIARDITPYFRVLKVRLEVPEDITIEPRMPVLVADGVVGQIHAVYGDFADVVIAADPRSRIDVISQRTRARGVVEGLGHSADYLARVGYLRTKDEVREGDVFVTSGMGGVFPAEVVVGEVSEVERDEEGLFQEARVEPSVDFSRLEEVFVLVGVDE